MRRFVLTLLAVAALAACSIATQESESRFIVVEPALVENADFARRGEGWHASGGGLRLHPGEPSVVAFHASGVEHRVQLLRPVPRPGETADHVRVSAWLRADAIVPGPSVWQRGQLRLVSLDQKSTRMWYWPQRVAVLEGTTQWRHYSLVVPWSSEVKQMWLLAYLSAQSGRMLLRDLEVEGVRERDAFRHAHLVIMAAWGALLLWVLRSLLRRGRASPLRIAAVALGCAFLVGGSAPQPHLKNTIAQTALLKQDAFDEAAEIRDGLTRPEEAGPSSQTVPSDDADAPAASEGGTSARNPGPAPPDDEPDATSESAGSPERSSEAATSAPRRHAELSTLVNSDKEGHLAAFAVFALLAALAWREHGILTAGVGALALSATIQALQALTVTREPDWADLRYDAAGIAIGLLVATLLLAVARRLRAVATLRG